MNPFDYLNAINHGKNDVIRDSDNPELAEKLYSPYLINRGLSYFIDTIYAANEMNVHHDIDPLLQFDFLINIVRKNKRYSKWYKPQPDDDVSTVMQYYDYSQDKARQVVDLLTKDQLTIISKSQSKGGSNDNDSRSND